MPCEPKKFKSAEAKRKYEAYKAIHVKKAEAEPKKKVKAKSKKKKKA